MPRRECRGIRDRLEFFLLQAAARVMKESGGGRIVNVSSPGTRMTLTNYTSYATSKAAVDYITRTAAANLGVYGITVNAIAPGRMDTPMQRITEEANAAAAGIDLKTYIQSRTVDIPLRRRTTLYRAESAASVRNSPRKVPVRARRMPEPP